MAFLPVCSAGTGGGERESRDAPWQNRVSGWCSCLRP
jgi:hypothetical protein